MSSFLGITITYNDPGVAVEYFLKKRQIAPKCDHVDFPRGFPAALLLPSGNVSSKILNDFSLHKKMTNSNSLLYLYFKQK